jgi:hypothetical protein
MASLNQISDSVLDLGQFIGLLKNNDTVNIAWFNTPINSLETINTRLALLVSTFYDVLDSPIQAPPIIDTYWLQIENPLNQLAAMTQIQSGQQGQQLNALKIREAEQDIENRNMLRGLDPNDPDYISKITRVDPKLGIEIAQKQALAK